MEESVPEVRYEACWTEIDGVFSCGCRHVSIREAMSCLVPDGRTFIRAVEKGVSRSLDEPEWKEFLAELGRLPGRRSP